MEMKRSRPSSRKRISDDANELVRLATGLAESGGRLEAKLWDKQLTELVCKLLHDGAEDDLNASLDRLFDSHALAHDSLADLIESRAESCLLSHQGQDYDILLSPTLAAPPVKLVALLDSGGNNRQECIADAEDAAWRTPVLGKRANGAGRLPVQP